jgi:predicted HicB family RNase H-like nuclease
LTTPGKGDRFVSVSEKRHRTKMAGVRLLPEEHQALKSIADEQGVSMSELIVNSLRHAGIDVIAPQFV